MRESVFREIRVEGKPALLRSSIYGLVVMWDEHVATNASAGASADDVGDETTIAELESLGYKVEKA